MKEGPEFRIVGGSSPEKKEEAKKELEEAFFRHFESLSPEERKLLRKFEYPKSETELALIDFANKETSKLMQEAGLKPYEIPVENLHIIPPELYRNFASPGSLATTLIPKQEILFDAQNFRDNPVNFGAIALHEMLHLKAHFSMEVEEKEENLEKTPYREGVSVKALQRHGYHGKYHVHFAGLHEAIVAETEKRLIPKLLEQPVLIKEKEWLNSQKAKNIKEEIAKKEEVPLDDIFWVSKDVDKEENCDYRYIAYRQQRDVLNYVCAEIQKQFPEKFQNPDDVYKLFLNAHFTGRLLEIGRLVEKTFGKESFRILGNMGTEGKSAVLCFETLKKMRLRQKKKR
jgi:hypothetical protein